MALPEQVTIHADEATAGASHMLLTFSALKYCTTRNGDTASRNWPSLSSGEQVLWQVLAHINGQAEAPPADTIAAELDDLNAHYATSAISIAGGV